MIQRSTPGNIDSAARQHLKRAPILRQARAAFVALGYAATKIEPIARDAGVSTATLYSIFDGKADLFAAVIDDAADEFAARIAGFAEGPGDARVQLLRFSTAYVDFMGDSEVRSIFRLVISERRQFDAVANRFVERGRSDFGAVLIQLLKGLVSQGDLRPIDKLSWAAGQLMGMLEHPVFFMPLVAGDAGQVRRSRAEIVEDAVTTFLARYGV